MTFQLNTKILFDGKPPKEFTKAVKDLQTGKFRSNPKERAKILGLSTLSDFFSGKGVRSGYGIEGLLSGFLGEPSKAEAKGKGYVAASSTPDIEVKENDLRKLYPKALVDQLVAEQQAVSQETGLNLGDDLLTLELKQTVAQGKTKESITQQTPGKAVLDSLTDRTAKVLSTKGVASKLLMNWFLTEADPAYRKLVITAIKQKIVNLKTITYVDERGGFLKKPSIAVTPGAGRILNLDSPASFRKYVSVELFGSRTKGFGSIQYNLNAAAYAAIKKHAIDVTTPVLSKLGSNFGERLFQYYVRGGGSNLVNKRSGIELVQTYAELIALAAQFDPSMGGESFKVQTETDVTTKMGAIASRAKPNLTGARKRKLVPRDLQAAVSKEQIEALARRMFRSKMPKGTPGGPPKPNPAILTERTGRFAESFQILRINEKNSFLEYTYDPIYNVFESERRAPSALIEKQGLRPAVQQLIGKYYRFIRK